MTMTDLHTAADLAEYIGTVAHNANRKALRDHESIEQAGETGNYDDPYDVLEGHLRAARSAVDRAISRVQFLRTHLHDWDERSFCRHCGADGAS